MKKLKYVLIPVICLSLASCSQQKNKEGESLVETQGGTQTEPFNLAQLKAGQNINEILKSAGATAKDALRTTDVTLIGNEKLAFSSKELLHFNGIDLEGKNNKNINKVLLHFGKVDQEIGPLANEKENELGMYQLDIYTEHEKKALLDNLNRTLQKPSFDTIREGFESEVKDNEIIQTHNKFRQEVAIWRNRDMLYYYCETKIDNKPDEYRCNLFVFKNKEWKDLLKGSGYPDLDKISL
ncbi:MULTISPECIES: hypothetical protein [Chryseobacterium]|uniref:Lipoprotein n=1 Tax=Chryseobacterium candidae TaxID=1978493 RepID=A0ABY2R4U6_9FLAO|nr:MULTISPECIES: hypothetical protein [Chryseobacterium]PXW16740.1 hypothetical protein C8D70_103240 [Chryseobacterium sp. CBTAP 102]THV57679.1 hypothetical protein EK417_14750 [Chryseobacterium candidae]